MHVVPARIETKTPGPAATRLLAHNADLEYLAPSPGEFFRAAPDLAGKRAADEVYPPGRLFPFTYFSTGGGTETPGVCPTDEEIKQTLAQVKEEGATMVGPQYELSDRILDDAKEHGMKAMYTISGAGLIESDKEREDLKVMAAPEVVKEGIRKHVRAAMNGPHVWWWYLTPE